MLARVLLRVFYSTAEVLLECSSISLKLSILGVLQVFNILYCGYYLYSHMYSYSQHSQDLGHQYCSYSKYSELATEPAPPPPPSTPPAASTPILSVFGVRKILDTPTASVSQPFYISCCASKPRTLSSYLLHCCCGSTAVGAGGIPFPCSLPPGSGQPNLSPVTKHSACSSRVEGVYPP